jgi:hypothetical protein
MWRNLVRLSKTNDLPFARSTFYKWHCLNKYPNLFVKIAGSLFVDLAALDRIVEEGRKK